MGKDQEEAPRINFGEKGRRIARSESRIRPNSNRDGKGL